jgi:uncharacterized membrane protein
MEPATAVPEPVPQASATVAKANYFLFLATLVTGVTSIAGVVLAYAQRDAAPDWLKTHYRFQIRTFWFMLIYGFIGLVLSFVVIGYAILAFIAVWLVIRSVKGLRALDRGEAVVDPST